MSGKPRMSAGPRVEDLRAALIDRGLDVTGTKSTLTRRLDAALCKDEKIAAAVASHEAYEAKHGYGVASNCRNNNKRKRSGDADGGLQGEKEVVKDTKTTESLITLRSRSTRGLCWSPEEEVLVQEERIDTETESLISEEQDYEEDVEEYESLITEEQEYEEDVEEYEEEVLMQEEDPEQFTDTPGGEQYVSFQEQDFDVADQFQAEDVGADEEFAEDDGYDPEFAEDDGYDPEFAEDDGYDPEFAEDAGHDPEFAEDDGHDGYDPEFAEDDGYDSDASF